jgi:hypothetical protein
MNKLDCDHTICQYIRDNNGNHKGSAGCMVFTYFKSEWIAVLGKERKGKYQGKYNICCGKGENTNCYIINAIRELNEEFHIEINMDDFLKTVRRTNKEIRLVIEKKTPIFISVIRDLDRNLLNQKIKSFHHEKYDDHLKEIENIDYFKLNGSKFDDMINKNSVEVSEFALNILNIYNKLYR